MLEDPYGHKFLVGPDIDPASDGHHVHYLVEVGHPCETFEYNINGVGGLGLRDPGILQFSRTGWSRSGLPSSFVGPFMSPGWLLHLISRSIPKNGSSHPDIIRARQTKKEVPLRLQPCVRIVVFPGHEVRDRRHIDVYQRLA